MSEKQLQFSCSGGTILHSHYVTSFYSASFHSFVVREVVKNAFIEIYLNIEERLWDDNKGFGWADLANISMRLKQQFRCLHRRFSLWLVCAHISCSCKERTNLKFFFTYPVCFTVMFITFVDDHILHCVLINVCDHYIWMLSMFFLFLVCWIMLPLASSQNCFCWVSDFRRTSSQKLRGVSQNQTGFFFFNDLLCLILF